ncbi:MAG: hypothetical protein U1F16_04245 [Turneriella sp.]
MKRFIQIALIACGLMTFSISAQDAEPATSELEASSVLVTVYKIALSTSNLCTSPTVIFQSNSGTQVDIKQVPTLGKGKLANGTYNCLMVEIGKMFNVAASSTQDGNANTTCTTTVNRRACADTQPSKLIDGSAVTCQDSQDNSNPPQRITLFFTTLSTNTNVSTTATNALMPPQTTADTTHAFSLSAPIVYPTNKKARLKLKKKIILGNSGCELQARPSMVVE